MFIRFDPEADKTVVSHWLGLTFIHAFHESKPELIKVHEGNLNDFYYSYCEECSYFYRNCDEEERGYYTEDEYEWDEEEEEDVLVSGGEWIERDEEDWPGCRGGRGLLEEGRCDAHDLEDFIEEREFKIHLPDHIFTVKIEGWAYSMHLNMYREREIEIDNCASCRIEVLPLLLANVYNFYGNESKSSIGKICWGSVEFKLTDMAEAYLLFFNSVFNEDLIPGGDSPADWFRDWDADQVEDYAQTDWVDYTDLVEEHEPTPERAIGWFKWQGYDPSDEESFEMLQGFVYQMGSRYFVEAHKGIYEISIDPHCYTKEQVKRRILPEEMEQILKEAGFEEVVDAESAPKEADPETGSDLIDQAEEEEIDQQINSQELVEV